MQEKTYTNEEKERKKYNLCAIATLSTFEGKNVKVTINFKDTDSPKYLKEIAFRRLAHKTYQENLQANVKSVDIRIEKAKL